MSLFLRRSGDDGDRRPDDDGAQPWSGDDGEPWSDNAAADDGDEDVEEVVGWRSLFRLRPGMTRRDVVGVVVVLVLIVAVCFPLGVGLQLWWESRQEREPQPWETALASGHTPRPTTPAPSDDASASASASSALSAEEQALREVALATPAPERPEGMDQFTPEGAAATAEYFMSLYPYVYATGDLTQWQAMSDPECIFCNNVIEKVTELHTAGGWIDPWQQEVVTVSYGTTDDDHVLIITLDTSHDDGLRHDGSGGTSTVNAEELTLLLQLRWNGQEWITEAGESR